LIPDLQTAQGEVICPLMILVKAVPGGGLKASLQLQNGRAKVPDLLINWRRFPAHNSDEFQTRPNEG
jgi:hypothetical protein